MKRHLLYLCVFFGVLSNSAHSQSYYPLPTDGTGKWYIESGSSGFMIPSFWTCGLHNDSTGAHDTLIGSYVYQKLYYAAQFVPSKYIGAYRSDTIGKTWFVPVDSLSEYLIMDLSAQPGDTIRLLSVTPIDAFSATIWTWSFLDYRIDSTGVFNSFNRQLKIVYGICITQFTSFDTEVWIESVGNLWGVFQCNHTGLDYSEVICASSRDTAWVTAPRPPGFGPPPYTLSYAVSDCPFVFYYITDVSETNSPDLSVSTNPANETVTIIQTEHTYSSFEIVSLTGQVLANGVLNDSENNLSLAGIPSGLYLLRFQGGAGVTTKRIEIVH